MDGGSPDFIMTDDDAAPSERKSEPWVTTDRIAGFYIACIDNGPNLSVFVPSPGKKPNIFMPPLTDIAPLRL